MSPSTMCRSVRQTPHAATSINRSRSCGCSISRATSRSGSPGWLSCMAIAGGMELILHEHPLERLDATAFLPLYELDVERRQDGAPDDVHDCTHRSAQDDAHDREVGACPAHSKHQEH